MPRIVVIGLDSATFDVIESHLEELPNFSRIMKEGCWGRLASVFPPVTPPAWTSFMTGKNPGKHGIFDFYGNTSSGYERKVVSSKDIRSKTLWRLLSESGKKVGVINVPITYPPEKVNGFVIPGMQYSLGGGGPFTYPEGLLSEVEGKFGKYEVMYGDEMALYMDNLDFFVKKWKEITRKRRDVILYLLDRYPSDFLMSVFYSLDPIQHQFWKFYDPAHPLHDKGLAPKYSPVIPEFYRLIDGYIGEIMDRAGADSNFFIVSDHGAGPHTGGFYANDWLMRKKLLRVKARYYPFLKIKWPHIVYKVLRKLGFDFIAWTIPLSQYNRLKNAVDPRAGLSLARIIDWERTKAYAGNYTEQGIYINLRGRETHGSVGKEDYARIREEIIRGLREIKVPGTGESLIEGVVRKEDIYKGPYVEFAPDVFIAMKGGSVLMQKDLHDGMFLKNPHISGTHRMEGVFLARGPLVRPAGKVEGLNIIDLAPTLLHLSGVPVPEDMDGRVVGEIIDPGYLRENPAMYGAHSQLGEGGQSAYTDEEAERIKQSLRNLGYY